MKALNWVLMLSASALAIIRLISYKYESVLSPETLKMLTVISVICGIITAVCALIIVIESSRRLPIS